MLHDRFVVPVLHLCPSGYIHNPHIKNTVNDKSIGKKKIAFLRIEYAIPQYVFCKDSER